MSIETISVFTKIWPSWDSHDENLGEAGGGGGGGWRGELGNLGVILVRVCEPVFQNLPHSYTWPSKKRTHSFIYLIIQNVDLFIYCPLIFCTHFLLVITQIS